jgi:hypothetical protein
MVQNRLKSALIPKVERSEMSEKAYLFPLALVLHRISFHSREQFGTSTGKRHLSA